VLRERGIGVLIVDPGYYSEPEARPYTYCEPRLNRKAASDVIRESLCEEQKTYSTAGASNGKRWTPFQRTIREVRAMVSKQPGIHVKALVDSISHHYATDSGARASIPHWIRAGVIAGVELRRDGKFLRLYPTGGDNGP
jgi:hypothetical protein